MSINPSKSTVLHVPPVDTQKRLEYGAIIINGKAVEVAACHKFLGNVIDDKLSEPVPLTSVGRLLMFIFLRRVFTDARPRKVSVAAASSGHK